MDASRPRGRPSSEVAIVLIGLRGSGKTTVGRLLAERLARPFVDLDRVTTERLGGANVTEAWKAHGEAGFRRAERECLALELKHPGTVLSLGGGTPTAPGAAELLRAAKIRHSVFVVYLRCSPEELRKRLRGQMQDRPSLTGRDPLEEMGEVFRRRDPLYRGLADTVVEDATAEQSVAKIVRILDASLARW